MTASPASRTQSLRERLEFAETDDLLRDDVRRLGAMVGEMLAEQVSPAFLEKVESVRKAAIARRENGEAVDALADRWGGIELREAESLVRAFAAYFGAINLAERVHRIRRRRDHQRNDEAPQPGGIEAVLRELRDEGVSGEEVESLLSEMLIEPVFTAHPTEVIRHAVLLKEQTVVSRLVADIDRGRTPPERRADEARIRLSLTATWQTSEAPLEKPTVRDEVDHIGFYLDDVLYRALPVYYETFAEAFESVFGRWIEIPNVLRFGTWVGGDMDGNPSVGASTMRAALEAQRSKVLSSYVSDLRALESILTQTRDRIGVDEAIDECSRTSRAALAMDDGRTEPSDMPYRDLLSLIAARLSQTKVDGPGGYDGVSAFLGDLDVIDRSLARNRGEHAGRFALGRVIRRARSFGFHMAALDLRQHSGVHEAALAALEGETEVPSRSVSERVERLHRLIEGAPVATADAEAAQSTLDVFRAVSSLRARFGPHAFGPYIVSMSRNAADALSVLALARIAGCHEAGEVPLDVAPLFETVEDLEAATATMSELFGDPVYRRHLSSRGDRQMVMLGYSDSAKDGGLLASRWALQRAQVELLALAQKSGIKIAFFHGRGGSVSRGGGKTGRAIVASPRGSVAGRLRVTEQGEVIHRKYGIRAIAVRNLEETTGAVLKVSLRPRPPEPREVKWREIMTELARVSRDHYRALVYENADFNDYFRAATPIDVIERLRIGSRPTRRGQGGIDSLRAIPWVFAWSQNRSGLTAWYGMGRALRHGLETHGLEVMRDMARDWPFFAATLADVEMLMAKSDLSIFERYSLLAGDRHPALFDAIADEHAMARRSILELKEKDELLADDYRLRLSIRLRNPYVDPISLLQVELLRRWREGGREDEGLFRALLSTVNGIAAGIQNTG